MANSPEKKWTAGARVAVATLAIGLSAWGAATAAGSAGKPAVPRGCATLAPQGVAPNPWAAARAKLAPAGASAIRVCRYDGLIATPPGQLIRSVLITRHSAVAALVREFDRLPPFRGTYSCPLDSGAQIVALLAYPSGHRVTIGFQPRGCNAAINGGVTRTALGQPGQKLLARLERLTS